MSNQTLSGHSGKKREKSQKSLTFAIPDSSENVT